MMPVSAAKQQQGEDTAVQSVTQRKAYSPASKFFSAAYMYADDNVKARTARVLSVCNIGQQDLPKYGSRLQQHVVYMSTPV